MGRVRPPQTHGFGIHGRGRGQCGTTGDFFRVRFDGQRMFAFPFKGYWKDVGTIDSLWEANLDIINPNVDLDLSDKSWRIYSRTPNSPPHYIGANAVIENSSVSEGCDIDGLVDYSVVSPNVTIEEGAEVRFSQ